MKFTKLDYCQYLLSTQINYTLTYLAEHSYNFSHDTINRYLREEKIPPSLLWNNVKQVIQFSEQAYIIFDDHVEAMLKSLVSSKLLPFTTVLMDSWYTTKTIMQLIDSLGKYYYCPLKKNRLVDDTGGRQKYQKIELLNWDESESRSGKSVKTHIPHFDL